MAPIRFIWERRENFDTIHKRLAQLKGMLVENCKNQKRPFMIFDVSEIEKSETESLGSGFFRFLEGDEKFQTKDGGYNFNGLKHSPTWCFVVTFGFMELNGMKTSWNYNFHIPRTDFYADDLKNNGIVFDPNHPFVAYRWEIDK